MSLVLPIYIWPIFHLLICLAPQAVGAVNAVLALLLHREDEEADERGGGPDGIATEGANAAGRVCVV